MDDRLKGRRFSRILGNIYGRLTVIDDLVYWEKGKQRKVLCQCSCENKTERLVGVAQLNDGNTKSCGCLQKEALVKRNFKHGLSNRKERDPVYTLIYNIINRCYNKNHKRYKDYGGRGIRICKKWLDNKTLFFDWCLNNGWKDGLTIDRIDNDGDYRPDNCRFITRQKNNENRRLLQSRNKSGFRGVYKKKHNYVARIVRKNITLLDKSGFKTAKAAAIARDTYCIKNNIPYALNFPELAVSWCL